MYHIIVCGPQSVTRKPPPPRWSPMILLTPSPRSRRRRHHRSHRNRPAGNRFPVLAEVYDQNRLNNCSPSQVTCSSLR